jgi:hypothetical protein
LTWPCTFTLHGSALAVSTLAIAAIPSDAAATVAGLVVLAYATWFGLTTAHRIFGDSWGTTIAKAAVVTALYCVGFFVMSLAMLAFALLRM